MCRTRLFAVICLWLLAGVAHSAPSATATVESHLDGSTIINAPVVKLAPALQASVGENEKRSPEFVYAILAGGRADANALAPLMVTTAINSLSSPKSVTLIVDIVEAALRATPDMVLKIVRAAILCSPNEAAPGIVRVAVASLKDVKHMADVSPETVRSFKDSKEYKDFKQVADNPDGLTPAERIVQTALQANPNLNPDNLTIAATTGLTGIPVDNDAHYAIWPPIIPVVSK